MHPQEYVKKMALLALFFGFAIAAPLALVSSIPAYFLIFLSPVPVLNDDRLRKVLSRPTLASHAFELSRSTMASDGFALKRLNKSTTSA